MDAMLKDAWDSFETVLSWQMVLDANSRFFEKRAPAATLFETIERIADR